jgi:hypothetical protein
MSSFEPLLYPSETARGETPVKRFAEQVPGNAKQHNKTVTTRRVSWAEASRRRRKMPVNN